MTDVFGTYDETPAVEGFDFSDHEFDTPMLETGQYRLKINGLKLVSGSQTSSKTYFVKFTVLAHRVEDEWVNDKTAGEDLECMFNLIKSDGDMNHWGVKSFNALLRAVGYGEGSLFDALREAKEVGTQLSPTESDFVGWVIEGRVSGKENLDRGDVTYNINGIVPHLDDTETRVRL